MTDQAPLSQHGRDAVIATSMSIVFIAAIVVAYLVIGRNGSFADLAHRIYSSFVQ